ncbi:MAG: 3'-5' exonuclease [Luteibaculaceae bacterium]
MSPLKQEITNEEIAQLPLGAFEGVIVEITKRDQVEEAVKLLKEHLVLGIDTETKPAFKKGVKHETALLQLATPGKAFLFRLNQIGLSDMLVDLLNDKKIIKVGLALHDDIADLRRLNSLLDAKSMVDLNVLAPKLGFKNIGAKKLTAMILGFRISKSQQVTDWETAVLSEAQKTYAATDAWICLEIYQKLKAENYL